MILIDSHRQFDYRSPNPVVYHEFWKKGDCVVCGKCFCVDRVPLRIRYQEKGKVLPAYICGKCGQGYINLKGKISNARV